MGERNSPTDTVKHFSDRARWFATAIDTELEFESLNSTTMIAEWSLLIVPLRESVGELAIGATGTPAETVRALRRAYLSFDNLARIRREEPHEYLSKLSWYVHVVRQTLDGLEPTDVCEFRFLSPHTSKDRFLDSLECLHSTRMCERNATWIDMRRAVIFLLAEWVSEPNFFHNSELRRSLDSLHKFVVRQIEQTSQQSPRDFSGYPRLLDWLRGVDHALSMGAMASL